MSKLERGVEATEKLLKIIPEEDLERVIRVYWIIKTCTGKQVNLVSLNKGIIGIRDCLTMLKGNGYISETAKENVLDTLIDGLKIYENENDELIYILTALVFKSARGGRPDKWHLDLFLLEMIKLMDSNNIKRNYSLLADFLSEQNLLDEEGKHTLSSGALEKRFERLNVDRIYQISMLMAFLGETGKLRNMPKWARRDTVKSFLREKLLP